MEASSRLRAAEYGARITLQARAEDRQRIERIATVRDAYIVAEEPLAPKHAAVEGLVNFILEKRAA